ncbi:MAG TPA: c-type cytochrome [Bacteroidales bacterium]|nr:c-type cytochrome [Bacteroidales bacterium]
MIQHFPFAAIMLLLTMKVPLLAQSGGDELFKTTCAACHTINKGPLVGPDLSGIHHRRDEEWLISFIRSSQLMIKGGDTAALALYEAYKRIPMPDNKLTDQEILNILDYIQKSDGKAPVSQPTDVPTDSTGIYYSTELVTFGRMLFNGYTRFKNGSSPCLACHHITDQSILGGGKLSLDLTGAYTKLGSAGISAIISNPPFPAMSRALRDHPVTEDEILATLALLKTVDQRPALPKTKDSGGLAFLMMTFVIALMMLVHIYLLYDKREIP